MSLPAPPELSVFFAVARYGSLRGAADHLGVGSPAVSQRLKALEAALGTQLFVRTTRSVELTEAGRLLLTRAGPATAEIEDALRAVRGLSTTERGELRITLPVGAFRLALSSRLPRFRDTYPDIQLDFSFEEAFVDLISEGYHAGVRLGGAIHGDMIAVPLTATLQDAFVAAPSYLLRYGSPETPDDLLKHNCIRYRYKTSGGQYPWRFQMPAEEIAVEVTGGMIVDSFDAGIEAARAGYGIAQNFRAEVKDDLESGRLVSLLDAYVMDRPAFHLYFPREYATLRVLRAFVDFFKH